MKKVKTLTAEQSHEISVFCGGSRNSHHFIHLFDKVFVLEVDHNTLMQRLLRRPEDEFGRRAVERELIAQLHATGEDLVRGGVGVDARRRVEEVVDRAILKACWKEPILSTPEKFVQNQSS